MIRSVSIACFSVLFAACSSTSGQRSVVDESRRVIGSQDGVRIDAQVLADEVSPGSVVRISYEIENLRNEPILIPDISPQTEYDVGSRTIVVYLGSEIPGGARVPTLVRIDAGTKKSFNKGARMTVYMPTNSPTMPYPKYVKVRVSFLGDAKPFESLELQKTPIPAQTSLFSEWVESIRSVVTNAIPIYWGPSRPSEIDRPAFMR